MKKTIFISSVVFVALVIAVISVAASTTNAEYYAHSGTITPNTSTIPDAVAVPDDNKFVQLAPQSWISLRFPGNSAAVPDGTGAADLRIDTFDVPYLANAKIFTSLDGVNWTLVGVYPDTADIDLDLNGGGPVKFVKVDQSDEYIDPAYPTLGFDLDAVVALNSGILPYGEITKPEAGVTVSGSVLFEALYWDDDPLNVQWAVRNGTCAAATNTVFGNVDGFNDSYTWDGNLFQATADTSTWVPGDYCFVFNPKESSGEGDVRLTQFNVVAAPNQPPVLTVDLSPVAVNEGNTASNGGAVSDPDGDFVTLSASIGTVTNNGDGTWSWSFDTNDGPADSQTVTINADDGNDGSAQTSFSLTVNNVAPTIESINVPLSPFNINDQPVPITASFSDPAGTNDVPYTCTVDYDDDSGPQAGTVSGTECTGPGSSYAEAGVYTVTVEVTDKDGGVGSADASTYVVIYDPSAGFVTGGGWIYSVPGAYVPDPELEGKATFGFVAKYKKGSSVPTGNTEFQFRAADLNFHSGSYQWLVIAGFKAMYKGTGTINGEGNYGFMLTAIDAKLRTSTDVDLFRIKIWEISSGNVIYDNQGGFNFNDPTTEIGGGSIVIHSGK